MGATEPSHLGSPGPAGVHLDDISVPSFGPQEPGLAPAARPAVAVEDVVATETLRAADLQQLVVLSVLWEVKGPQCCLLQDSSGSAQASNKRW